MLIELGLIQFKFNCNNNFWNYNRDQDRNL